jgi:sulfonate transport system substrate-binding protein
MIGTKGSSTILRLGGVPEHFNYPIELLLKEGKGNTGDDIGFEFTPYPGGTGAMLEALTSDAEDAVLVLSEGALRYMHSVEAGLKSVTDFNKDINGGGKERGNTLTIASLFVETGLEWGIYTGANSGIGTVSGLAGKPFAISRKGSGSQVMTFVLGQKEGWTMAPSFIEVGNLEGAKHALTQNEAAGFLWEATMTRPLVEAGYFTQLGVLEAPWPAFCCVAKAGFLAERGEELSRLLNRIYKRAMTFSQQEDAPTMLSARFGFDIELARNWLSKTVWAQPGTILKREQIEQIFASLRDAGAL